MFSINLLPHSNHSSVQQGWSLRGLLTLDRAVSDASCSSRISTISSLPSLAAVCRGVHLFCGTARGKDQHTKHVART